MLIFGVISGTSLLCESVVTYTYCFAFYLMAMQLKHAWQDQRILYDYVLTLHIENKLMIIKVRADYSSTIMYRTTNPCESFHTRFNSEFGSSNSHFYLLIRALKVIQCDVYIYRKRVVFKSDESVSKKKSCMYMRTYPYF